MKLSGKPRASIERRIALNGMKGRRKDSVLLLLVVILSFAFIVTATTYEASISVTEAEERVALYGRWHAACLASSEDDVAFLTASPKVSESAVSEIFGLSQLYGNLGSLNDGVAELMGITMLSGRLPEADGEAAIELGQLYKAGLDESAVGTEITIETEYQLVPRDQTGYDEYAYARYTELEAEGKTNIVEETRNLNKMQMYGPASEIQMYLRESFRYVGEAGGFTSEQMEADGFLLSRSLFVRQTFTVVGIINTYSERCDTSVYPVVNTAITEGSAKLLSEALANITLISPSEIETQSCAYTYNIFLCSDVCGDGLCEALLPDVLEHWGDDGEQFGGYDSLDAGEGASRFRRNDRAYPLAEAAPRSQLLAVVTAVAFAATALAVLQIFLTQVRRRARTVSLLKCVGADNKIIAKIFFWEGLSLLAVGLPLGVGAGFLLSFGVVSGMNALGAAKLAYTVDLPSLSAGLGVGVSALFFGMLFPSVAALRQPLTGTVSRPPKLGKRSRRPSALARLFARRKDTAARARAELELRHLGQNKTRTAMSFLLSALTCAVCAASLLLVSFSYQDYNEAVAIPARPDYAIELPYSMSDRQLAAFKKQLLGVRGVSSALVYEKGERLQLWFDGIETDELLAEFKSLLPSSLVSSHFGLAERNPTISWDVDDAEEKLAQSFVTTFYCASPSSAEFDAICAAITSGSVDRARYAVGTEVILLSPSTVRGGEAHAVDAADILRTNFHNRASELLAASGAAKLSFSRFDLTVDSVSFGSLGAGDTVYLTANAQRLVDEYTLDEYSVLSASVGAVVEYFPGAGVWPFTQTAQPYVIVGSPALFQKLYAGAGDPKFADMSGQSITNMAEIIADVKYGRTVFYLNANVFANYDVTDAELARLVYERGGVITNYRENNRAYLGAAQNSAAIIALLGITAAALASIILYNTLASRAEQERHRVGVLQSIGLTARQLRAQSARAGLAAALGSLVLTAAVCAAAVVSAAAVIAARAGEPLPLYLEKLFVGFPWAAAAAIAVGFTALTVWLHLLPTKKISAASPVDNMR